MNTRILIPLLLAGAVAMACGSRSHADATVKPTDKRLRMTGTPTLSAQTVTMKRSTPERADVAKLKSAFVVRAEARAIHFALELTNPGRKQVELSFPSGQEHDFAIVDAAGREVYRWSAERMFTQSIQNRLLDGGATMRIEERANTSLPNGDYVAVATLRSSNYPVQERVPFQLR